MPNKTTETITPRRRPGKLESLLRSIVGHTLAKWAGGFTTADDRERLEAGASYPVSIRIEATVDGKEFSEHLVGELRVGHDTPTNRSTADDDGVVGYLLGKLTAADRERVLVDLPGEFLAHDQTIPASGELRSEANSLRKKLRKLTPATNRGSVTFARAVGTGDDRRAA